MKQSIGFSQFINAFNAHDRLRTEDKGGNFDYDGARILFDYLENWEQETGEEIELDVISLCCDYSQSNFLDVARDYQIDISECADDEELRDLVADYLRENTTVCGQTDDFIVYQQF